jgi:hypothetical protein
MRCSVTVLLAASLVACGSSDSDSTGGSAATAGAGGGAAAGSGQAGSGQAGAAGKGGGAGLAGAGGKGGGGQAGSGVSGGGKGGGGQAGAGLGGGGQAGAGLAGAAGKGGAAGQAGSAGKAGAAGQGGAAGSGGATAASLTFPVTCSSSAFSTAKTTAPVIIDGMNDVVLDGIAVQNPNGACIVVKGGAAHVTIRNSAIGPCKTHGVDVQTATDVRVESSWIHDTTGNGVNALQATALVVETSCIEQVSTGVYAQQSTGVVVEKNAVKNVQGPFPRGQLTQLNAASGPGNRIRCNVLDDVAGQSNPEDAINVYKSNGTAASPILVEGNRIRGGGPSTSGGGILLGDGGDSSFQIARANVVVDPGQYGIAVASGANVTLDGNTVFSSQHVWSNVGVYVWNQYDSPCGPVLVTKNKALWTDKTGKKNSFWDGSQSPAMASFPVCASTTIATDNDWSAALDASAVQAVPAVCP